MFPRILIKIVNYLKQRHLLYLTVISIPILLVYGTALLSNASGLHYGDADFFFANAEAFRKSIITYNQFPWWNPWVSGGIPLYADPQFGLLSIQSVFILLFGSIVGWKLAIISYILIGFHGLRKLLISVFNTQEATAVVIALTWSFSLFWGFRAGAGHFTFFTLAYLPWALLAYWKLNIYKYGWVWLGLAISLAINSSPHNTTIMILVILGMLVAYDTLILAIKRKTPELTSFFASLTKAATLSLLLSIHKLLFTYKYASSNSHERTIDPEEFIGWKNILEALFTNNLTSGILPSGWGKQEALAGLGFGVLIALIIVTGYCLIRFIKRRKLSANNVYYTKVISITFCLFFVFFLSLGNFSRISLYGAIRELPVLENTRVAARWLIPTGFFMLLFIGSVKIPKKYRVIVNTILVINLLPLVATNIRNTGKTFTLTASHNQLKPNYEPPLQTVQWEAPRKSNLIFDDNLYNAVSSNVGQLSTNLTPFFDTKNGSTSRCDEIRILDCSFVLTNNAKVIFWSPNKIVLERFSSGPIELNMNVSRYWAVNNTYPFGGQSIASPNSAFIFDTPDSYIIIKYSPPGTFSWLQSKLN